jgi:hypothetical protein
MMISSWLAYPQKAVFIFDHERHREVDDDSLTHSHIHTQNVVIFIFLFFDRSPFGLDSFLESGTVSSLTYFSFLSLPALVVLVGSTMHA